MRAYIDSDILIWHLKGESNALNFLKKLHADHAYELWIGSMQRAEIVFFMRPEEEKDTLLFLSQFKTAPVNQVIIDAAAVLYRHWNPGHSININDALLAATVMHSGGVIFSLNEKHYPMPEIIVQKPW